MGTFLVAAYANQIQLSVAEVVLEPVAQHFERHVFAAKFQYLRPQLLPAQGFLVRRVPSKSVLGARSARCVIHDAWHFRRVPGQGEDQLLLEKRVAP